MMRRVMILIASLSLLAGGVVAAHAQEIEEEEGWSDLLRLSSLEGEAGEASMVADQYGYLHTFWVETGFDHARSVLQYSRYDGQDWTLPVSVYLSWPDVVIQSVSGAVTEEGRLFLIWTESLAGPVYYMSAAVEEAFSAQNWSDPLRLNLPASQLALRVDQEETFHVVYLSQQEENPGVFYTFSQNQGKSWSYPLRLDPDIPATASPSWLGFELDDSGGLHTVWSYADLTVPGTSGRWIRYAGSLDGGRTWSSPVSIDFAQGYEDEMRQPNPSIAVSGDSVVVVWAGDTETRREYRVSRDRGQTWQETQLAFGDLQGQAIGDGMAMDSLGRVHFAGQLRWPQAVYHLVWDGEAWSEPAMVYYIRADAKEEIAGRIHAHRVRVAVRGGNDLVLTFTTAPSEPQNILYVMTKRLEDAPAFEPVAAPTLPPTEAPLAVVAPTAAPEATTTQVVPTAVPRLSAGDLPAQTPAPPSLLATLWPGLLAAAVVIVGAGFARALRKRL